MQLEFSWKYPWIKKHICASDSSLVPSGVEGVQHKSWVKIPNGKIGWLHHHDVNGWYIYFPNEDTLMRTNDFVNIEAPANG